MKSCSEPGFFFFPPTGLHQCNISCVCVFLNFVFTKEKMFKIKSEWAWCRGNWWDVGRFYFFLMVLQIFSSKIPSPIHLNPAGASNSEVFSDSTNFLQFIFRKYSLYILPSLWDIWLMCCNGLMNCNVKSWYLIFDVLNLNLKFYQVVHSIVVSALQLFIFCSP